MKKKENMKKKEKLTAKAKAIKLVNGFKEKEEYCFKTSYFLQRTLVWHGSHFVYTKS